MMVHPQSLHWPGHRAESLTVHRHPQEEPVGDVDHGASQQAEDVHVLQALQAVQVRLRGGAAHLHRLLHARAGQSCPEESHSAQSNAFKNMIANYCYIFVH